MTLLALRLSPDARSSHDALIVLLKQWRDPANPTYRLTTNLIDSAASNQMLPWADTMLRRGDLAFVLDINHRDRRDGKTEIEITEPKVHFQWRRMDRVPRTVVNYIDEIRPRITILRSTTSRIIWTRKFDRKLVQLQMKHHSHFEVAHLLTLEMGTWVSAGAVTGRIGAHQGRGAATGLRSMTIAQLRRHGFNEAELNYLKPDTRERASAR
jgi:hypothetical protein